MIQIKWSLVVSEDGSGSDHSQFLIQHNHCYSNPSDTLIYLESPPRQEHHMLQEKLSALEKKVIVGGVDLLAKAEEQEKLLQESNNELEERRRRAEQLHKELEEKEVRRYI